MPSLTRSELRQVRLIDQERYALLKKATVAARAQAAKMVQRVLTASRTGRSVPNTFVQEMERIEQLLIQVLAVSYVYGLRRTRLLLPISDEIYFSDVYKSALKLLREKMNLTQEELDNISVGMQAQGVKVWQNATFTQEKKLQKVITEITEKGMHVKEGTAAIEKAFKKQGLHPFNSYTFENIFRTQTALAYSAGQHDQLQDPAIAEIHWGYKYVTVGDDRVRDTHSALNGTTLPKEHDFWIENTPPNGWSCRCTLIPIFESRDWVEPPALTESGLVPQADVGFQYHPSGVFSAPVESFSMQSWLKKCAEGNIPPKAALKSADPEYWKVKYHEYNLKYGHTTESHLIPKGNVKAPKPQAVKAKKTSAKVPAPAPKVKAKVVPKVKAKVVPKVKAQVVPKVKAHKKPDWMVQGYWDGLNKTEQKKVLQKIAELESLGMENPPPGLPSWLKNNYHEMPITQQKKLWKEYKSKKGGVSAVKKGAAKKSVAKPSPKTYVSQALTEEQHLIYQGLSAKNKKDIIKALKTGDFTDDMLNVGSDLSTGSGSGKAIGCKKISLRTAKDRKVYDELKSQADRMADEIDGMQAILKQQPVKEIELINGSTGFKSATTNGNYNYDLGQMKLKTSRRLQSLTSPKIGSFNVGGSVADTYRHELGHAIWDTMSPQQKRRWQQLYARQSKAIWKKRVSAYGSSNDHELFAESFSAFTHKGYGAKGKELPADIIEFFAKELKITRNVETVVVKKATKAGIDTYTGLPREAFKTQAEWDSYISKNYDLRGAILDYTDGWYEEIRNVERGLAKGKIRAKVAKKIEDLKKAYARRPDVGERVVWRGMSVGAKTLKTIAKKGAIMDIECWTSTSTSRRVAEGFSDGFGDSIVLKLRTREGMSISRHSEFKSEKEVLLPRGMKFKVTSVKRTVGEYGRYIVEAVEI